MIVGERGKYSGAAKVVDAKCPHLLILPTRAVRRVIDRRLVERVLPSAQRCKWAALMNCSAQLLDVFYPEPKLSSGASPRTVANSELICCVSPHLSVLFCPFLLHR